MAGILVFGVLAFMGLRTKIDGNAMFKWLGFGLTTLWVFADAIRERRRDWHRWRLWALLGAFFVVQCGLGVAFLWKLPKVQPIYWGLFLPFDYGLLTAYLAALLDTRRKQSISRPSQAARL